MEVSKLSQLHEFITFPDALYAGCPQYVPRLYAQEKKLLTEASTLTYCRRKLWMVMRDRTVVGRICALINPRYNAKYKLSRVRFGWFDCINDLEVARMLLDAACDWARGEGMTEIHGPLSYNTYLDLGMVVEGYENVPPVNCKYNYPYYNDFMAELGFSKEVDWLQNKMVANHGVPEKARRMARLCKEKYGIKLGNIDELKKDPARVQEFFRLYNDSLSEGVHGFVPYTQNETEELAKATLPFLSDKTCCILLDPGDAIIGFCIAEPSRSRAMIDSRGNSFLFKHYYSRRAARNYETIDLVVEGVAPQWRNKGLSSIYYREMGDKAIAVGCRFAISSPQTEKSSVANIWNDYEHEPFMTRRCYIKKLD